MMAEIKLNCISCHNSAVEVLDSVVRSPTVTEYKVKCGKCGRSYTVCMPTGRGEPNRER